MRNYELLISQGLYLLFVVLVLFHFQFLLQSNDFVAVLCCL